MCPRPYGVYLCPWLLRLCGWLSICLLGSSGSTKAFDEDTVLKFKAYFKEAVHESKMENHRVRKCEIFYFLSDHSIQINELKMENSGVPQGNFMTKHQVPKDEDSFLSLEDFEIGGMLTIYGRTFHIIDANEAAKQTLADMGKDVSMVSDYPPDSYETYRMAVMTRETGKDPSVSHKIRKNPMKEFAEASLGNTVNNSAREGFLKYDRKVLRFIGIWDDRQSLYGDVLQFKIHYFLTDNTIEVLSVYGANSGRDPFPLLLRRGKLPKPGAEESFYHWEDFEIGAHLNVYNRMIELLDADEKTRDFYEGQGRPLAEALQLQEEEPPKFERQVPPYTGFGSEEDSLTSCVGSLVQVPTPPARFPCPPVPACLSACVSLSDSVAQAPRPVCRGGHTKSHCHAFARTDRAEEGPGAKQNASLLGEPRVEPARGRGPRVRPAVLPSR